MNLGTELALFFLIIGITLLSAFFYLKWQSQRFRENLLSLYKINEEVNQDTLDFVDKAWKVLKKAQFKGIEGQICWYGQPKVIQQGVQAKEVYPIQFSEADIQVDLKVYADKQSGENRLLSSLLMQVFTTLLSHNIKNKTSQFLLSQQRLERYQLFVQHDAKNIAQFITLLNSQVASVNTIEEKAKLLDRLKVLLPAITERANQVIVQLTQPDNNVDEVSKLSLSYELEKVAHSIELSVKVNGDATLLISEVLLMQVLHNVMGNFKDHATTNVEVFVGIEQQDEGVVLNISRMLLKDDVQLMPERLFEPFWTSSESGMGLGLFLAREALNRIDGKVDFYQTEDSLGFSLFFPNVLIPTH